MTDNLLTSEPVDLEVEAKRIEAFSLYSPRFNLPSQLFPGNGYVVAETDIKDADIYHFFNVLVPSSSTIHPLISVIATLGMLSVTGI